MTHIPIRFRNDSSDAAKGSELNEDGLNDDEATPSTKRDDDEATWMTFYCCECAA